MASGIMRTILRLFANCLRRKKCYLLLLAGTFILLFSFHYAQFTTGDTMTIRVSRKDMISRMGTHQKEAALDMNNTGKQKQKAVRKMGNGLESAPLDVFDLKNVSVDQSECYPLRIRPPTQICVHSDKEDQYVSKNLRKNGIWERDAVALFQQALVRNPHLDVIDIGANLGLYSLTAAAMGRKVLSVEPLEDNIRRFHKSVKINSFEDRITLVTNAISNQHEKVYFKTYSENKGGTSMWEGKEECKDEKCLFARSVYMDDLVPLVKARNITNAIMKMDIEGAEHLAFAEASEFFSSVHIAMIFMEVAVQREFCGQQGGDTEDQILTKEMFKFLQQQGFTRVYTQSFTGRQLDPESCSRQWPRDVVWVRERQRFPPL